MASYLRKLWAAGNLGEDPQKAPPLFRLTHAVGELMADVVSHAVNPKKAFSLHVTTLSVGWHQVRKAWQELSQEADRLEKAGEARLKRE